jgi:hypothetical protein
VTLPLELQQLMHELSETFQHYGDFYLFLVGSLIHDLLHVGESKYANDFDLVLFVGKAENFFSPVLRYFFACPHVPGLYQLKVIGGSKVDLMVVEQDLTDPDFLVKQVITKHDFTISSLFCDIGGNIYDPSGRGLMDLRTRSLDLVSRPDVSQVINHLTFLRSLKYASRGFVISSALKDVLMGMSYLDAFRDDHFCNLLRRLITHHIEMVEFIKQTGFLEKLMDPGIDYSPMTICEIHHHLLMKSLKLATTDELKKELARVNDETESLSLEVKTLEAKLSVLKLASTARAATAESQSMLVSELKFIIEELKHDLSKVEALIGEKQAEKQAHQQLIHGLQKQKLELKAEQSELMQSLTKQESKQREILARQIKNDKDKSQKLNKKLSEQKKVASGLQDELLRVHEEFLKLKKDTELISLRREDYLSRFVQTRTDIDEKEENFSFLLQNSRARLFAPKIIKPGIQDSVRGLEPHPWESLDEETLQFIFTNWSDAVLKIPLGIRLAVLNMLKREDYQAIILLNLAQFLAKKHAPDYLSVIKNMLIKVKLKHPLVYWQIKTHKEWYGVGQQFYRVGRHIQALIFFFIAHDLDEEYIHPVIQIINVAISLKYWAFLELGLDALLKFFNPDNKFYSHAQKVLSGVYDKLNLEHERLSQKLKTASLEEFRIEVWNLVTIQSILQLFRGFEAKAWALPSLEDIKASYWSIIRNSEPISLGGLIAHLNLANLSQDPKESSQYFNTAIEMKLLPNLDQIFAARMEPAPTLSPKPH